MAFLLFNYVLVATARAQAFVARGLLASRPTPERGERDPQQSRAAVRRGGRGPSRALAQRLSPPTRVQLMGGDQAAAISHKHATHHAKAVQKELPCARRAIQYPPRHQLWKCLTRRRPRAAAGIPPGRASVLPSASPGGRPGTADRGLRLAAPGRRPLHDRPGAWFEEPAQYDAGQAGQAERTLKQVAPAQSTPTRRPC